MSLPSSMADFVPCVQKGLLESGSNKSNERYLMLNTDTESAHECMLLVVMLAL